MSFIVLILGLVLWAYFHFLRTAFPGFRQSLTDRFGEASKGIVAVGIVVSLALMILGYRATPFIEVWTPPAFMTHLNNLLMLFALYVYFQTATQPGTAWIMGNTKNPQLTGFKIWAVAHLLANGDLAAIVLFGGLLAWAVVQVILAKRMPSLVDRSAAKISSPVVHLGLVLVAYAVISGVHTWLGRWPFG